MIYIGIDPGITGAIAAIMEDGKSVKVFDVDRSLAGAIGFLRELCTQGECQAVIEKVGAMPGQGLTSTFNFGSTYGHLRGALLTLGIPIIEEPVPQVWKRGVGIPLNPPKCPKRPWKKGEKPTEAQKDAYLLEKKKHDQAKARYKRAQKDVSRERVRELYPWMACMLTRVEDNDRAEAILLAHYGMRGAGK